MQISHKTCRSGDAGRVAPLPLTGKCGPAPGGHAAPAPRPSPARRRAATPTGVGRGRRPAPGTAIARAGRKRPQQPPPRRGPSQRPTPTPGPASRPAQTPRAVTWVVSASESRNVTQTSLVGFSQTKIVNKTKQKKTRQQAGKIILIKKRKRQAAPQSPGARRLKGKARVCGDAWSGRGQ